MSDRKIIIDNLDTLADGVLDPATTNFYAAYLDMQIDLGVKLKIKLINLLALIVRLGDLGEEEVSLKELKSTPVNGGTLPKDIDAALEQLKQAGFIHTIDIIDDADGDLGIRIAPRFPID